MKERFDSVTQERLFEATLPSGLQLVVLPRPGFKQATATFATNYGSIDHHFVPPGGSEVRVPDGIAHFLEHKLFEEEWGNVFDKFSELGASVNAYTSWTQTVYYFSTTEHFAASFELLLDFVQSPYFTDESVKKEQGIIEQEIRMYLDDPGWRSTFNLLSALYVEHPVAIDIAGTVESIHQITKEDLYLCHGTFYHPSNMAVFVTGDVDPKAVYEQVSRNLAKRGLTAKGEIKRLIETEPKRVRQPRIEQQLTVNMPIFRLGFKDVTPVEKGQPYLQRDMLTSILLDVLFGKSSELNLALYEEGLIDDRFGAGYQGSLSYGFSSIGGPTREPERLEARLRAELQEAAVKGVDPEAFERNKKKLVGRLLQLFNSPASTAHVFNNNYFLGVQLDEILPAAQKLTVEQANARLKEHFVDEVSAVSLISPR